MFRKTTLVTVLLATPLAAATALAGHHEAGEAPAAAAAAEEALPSVDAQAPAAPAPPEWDAERVVELARAVHTSARELREIQRRKPPEHLASGQASARTRYIDNLRLAAAESRRLADAVESGKDRDQTLSSFRRTEELLRDTSEDARRMYLPKDTLDRIQALSQTVDELAFLYTGRSDGRSPLHGPTKDE